LGVVQPGSDMDTLCIAPPHVAREVQKNDEQKLI
jgi:poly(A) polymerase Pap1